MEIPVLTLSVWATRLLLEVRIISSNDLLSDLKNA